MRESTAFTGGAVIGRVNRATSVSRRAFVFLRRSSPAPLLVVCLSLLVVGQLSLQWSARASHSTLPSSVKREPSAAFVRRRGLKDAHGDDHGFFTFFLCSSAVLHADWSKELISRCLGQHSARLMQPCLVPRGGMGVPWVENEEPIYYNTSQEVRRACTASPLGALNGRERQVVFPCMVEIGKRRRAEEAKANRT